ncbi:MAG: NFACT family protein [Clostridia bacterium]|nr:NFACT family protein [Clostridia bacterium]
MAFDGAALHAVALELNEQLSGGRIDKIHQISKEQLRINIRTKAGAKRLLLSASANDARIHITNQPADNPQKPPMFCMMLRKYIGSGKIAEVRQHSVERIAEIVIDSRDELGNDIQYVLIHEIMGRHSNIILCRDGMIMDSIKRIDEDKSRVRQVLPKIKYEYPPEQDKLDPFMMDKDAFHELIIKNENLSPAVSLNRNIMGLSIASAKYLGFDEIDMDKPTNQLSGSEIATAAQNIYEYYNCLKENKIGYYLMADAATGLIDDFAILHKPPVNGSKITECTNASEMLDRYYAEIELSTQLKQLTNSLKQTLKIILKRTKKKLSKQEAILEDSSHADQYRLYGELLTAFQSSVPKGANEVELSNYYSESAERVKIPLNPEKSANVNAQIYYKKYQKLSRAAKLALEQVHQTKEELDYLEGMETAIENCGDISAAKEIIDEFISQGYIKKTAKKDTRKYTSSKPRHYVSEDGYHIYVGRNNSQNDHMTMKEAGADDVFMHTQKIPGSHVIVKSIDGKVSRQALSEGAILAAYYSKAKASSNVPVDYTLRKNIKKPNGAKPGYVIYSTHSTINVTPSEERMNNIKQI